MKRPSDHLLPRPLFRTWTARAFTLAELMTTVAVFSLVVIGMVSLQVFGFKMNSFASSKMKATADSLKALDQIGNQIREATEGVVIGNFDANNDVFTAIANSQPAIGNAIQISNGPASLVTFYLDTNTNTLYELISTASNQPVTLTRSAIINSQPFQKENCFGKTIAVGSSDHYTIKVTLLFSNLVYAVPAPIYDTYQLESRATPREQFDNN